MKIGTHQTVIHSIFSAFSAVSGTTNNFWTKNVNFTLSHKHNALDVRWVLAIIITCASSMNAIYFANTFVNELCTFWNLFYCERAPSLFLQLNINYIVNFIVTLVSLWACELVIIILFHVQTLAPALIEFTKFKIGSSGTGEIVPFGGRKRFEWERLQFTFSYSATILERVRTVFVDSTRRESWLN